MSFECLIQGGAQRTQGYGCTGLSIEPRCGTCAHYHSGWDLAAPCGREVYASCAGTVVQIGHDPGYGPYAVFVERDEHGVTELYGHLQDAAVQVGQRVYAGQLLGHVGTLGNSTGCHVHYSVRPPDDRLTECGSIDPAPYLCGCTAGRTGPAPLSGLATLLLLGAGPRPGLITYSPAAPGLGIDWEP